MPIPFWKQHSYTKGLVPSALVTFLSRPSSGKTSPRNQSLFYVNGKPLIFFHTVISYLGIASSYDIKQKFGACKQNFRHQRKIAERALKKSPGQRLCRLPKEIQSGRLILQLTSVQADRRAIAGLPDRQHGKQDGTFQKIFFLGLCLPEKLKDSEMGKSRTLTSRCKSRLCPFLAKRPLASYFISSVICSVA